MGTLIRDIGRKIRAPFNKRSALLEMEKFHTNQRSIEEIVGAAIKFPSKGLFRIESVQKRSEILALAGAVAELKPRNILEIGTDMGGTLFIWAHLAAKKVVSCDLLDPGERCDLYEEFSPQSPGCEVIHLTGNSHDAAFRQKVEAQFANEQVDFLFIDGDHTEKGVEQDYYDYKHLVRPGGLIAFHDIVEKQPVATNQVFYFWQRLKPSVNATEYIDDVEQTGFGIGLIKV